VVVVGVAGHADDRGAHYWWDGERGVATGEMDSDALRTPLGLTSQPPRASAHLVTASRTSGRPKMVFDLRTAGKSIRGARRIYRLGDCPTPRAG